MLRTAALFTCLTLAASACEASQELFDDNLRLLVHPGSLSEQSSLQLDLPSGPVELELALFDMRGPASYTMLGTLPGVPMAHAMIVYERGVVQARFSDPVRGSYQYTFSDAAGGALTEIEPPQVPLCGCACAHTDGSAKHPAHAPKAGAKLASASAVDGAGDGAFGGTGAAGNARGFELCRDSLTQIDVLVVYTPEALALAGDEPTLRATVQMSLDEFNLATTNSVTSSIRPTVRLAHLELTESQQTTSSSDLLNRLRETDDGFFDAVHPLRDRHAGDIVILLTGGIDVCGRAFIGVLPGNTPRPDLGFGVVAYSCATAPVYAMAHEIGHILGARHDIESDYCDTGDRRESHGYTDPELEFQTIMSVSTAPRVPYFSTTDSTFMGQAIGEPVFARNAFAFSVGAATTVARYRLSDCNGNLNCDTTELANGSLLDLDGDGVPDECEFDGDQNGIADDIEIMNDPALDLDLDGMLDSLEQAVHYVDPGASGAGTGLSWADAHTDLRDAFDAVARSGGDIAEIWMAGGTYTPGTSTQRGAVFYPPAGVTIYGGFAGTETDPGQRDIEANPTVFSGDLAGNDFVDSFNRHGENSYTLMQISGVDGVTLDGLTFYGGWGNSRTNCGFWNHGGGLACFGGSVTVRDCIFVGNGGNSGGAMGTVEGARSTIIDSDFVGNTLVNVENNNTGTIVLGTGASVGGVLLGAPSAGENLILNSRFTDNFGNGITNLGGAPMIVGSLVARNTGNFTAGISNSSVNGSDARIINCTIVDNVILSNSQGAGVSNFRSEDVRIINSIIWGNRGLSGASGLGTQISNAGGSEVFLDRSIVENYGFGSTAIIEGAGISAADPGFTDAPGGDYTLAAGSPAIDAGDTAQLDAVAITVDNAGGDRFVDDPSVADAGLTSITDPGRPVVDLGAFEKQVEVLTLCSADLDTNSMVDLDDFSIFIAQFGNGPGDCASGCSADLEGDDDVDLDDFSIFIAQFGNGPAECAPGG